MRIYEALRPPLDVGPLLEVVPELELAKGLEQGPFHHLDVFGHTLEVVRGIEREFDEARLGADVREDRTDALRLVGLLHDVAKPLTRGEYEGKVMFVAHDSLGARLVHRICRRLDASAETTDLVATLTALHLKIGFMANPRTDYPPQRIVWAAGPFGEELAVLSWADRLAAQGPRLNDEHIERHRALCEKFLEASREQGPHAMPDYESLAEKLGLAEAADVGYATSGLRALEARGLGREVALGYISGLR
ncbi:MAG: HD domain-containing protein [Actinomycetota bacterium]|nr:HD domain-containing protein [Actinomycetota bacterium]